jgi:regulator of replication initiation timing
MWDYEEDYYEPSAADMVLDEFKEKMKEVLLGTVKQEIELVKEENERLKEENKKFRERESKINYKERELESKENQLEYLFYRKKFSDLINPLVEKYVGYYISSTYRKPNKCDQCNDDRKIIYRSDNGKIIEKDCECNHNESYYVPKQTEIERLDLWKNEHDRKFVITPRYE